MENKDIAQGLEQIRDRINRLDFDDQTAEEKIRELQKTLRTGDDTVYVLDKAIERLGDDEQ